MMNTQVTFPFKAKIQSHFQIKAYHDTEEGLAKYNNWTKADKQISKINRFKKSSRTIMVTLVIIPILYSLFEAFKTRSSLSINNGFFILWGSLVLIVSIKRSFENFYLPRLAKKYKKGRSEWALRIAKKISEQVNAEYYILPDASIFLFSNKLAIFVDTVHGDSSGYGKSDIKKITLNRVFVKKVIIIDKLFTRIGNDQTIEKETLSFYEWWLDIYSSFGKQPHLKLIFALNGEQSKDNQTEDYLKKAYALLK